MGLTIRMALGLLLAAVLWAVTLGTLGWVIAEGYWILPLLLAGFAADGWQRQRRQRRRRFAAEVRPQDVARLEGALQRLSLVAGIAPPKAVVEAGRVPLSWTLWVPRRDPAVHMTKALLDRLDDDELEAVAGHELMHVVNRDAKIMTLLAGVPSLFFAGLQEMIEDHPVRGYLSALLYGLWFVPTGVLLLLAARVVSRHRELVADRGAAELTGSPAAVAGALVTLSAEVSGARDRDLRRAARTDLFHFLPARPHAGLLRPFATHPPLRERLARLERMERELQGAE